VTAGLYVLIRYSFIFTFLYGGVFILLSLLTIVLAGGFALVEMDIKKVVAMSTLRQLGMILFVMVVGG